MPGLNLPRVSPFLWLTWAFVLALNPRHLFASELWECRLAETEDLFQVGPEQYLDTIGAFQYYTMIDGLTVLVIHRETFKFNRLNHLNLLPSSTLDPNRPAEQAQYFSGQCKPVNQ